MSARHDQILKWAWGRGGPKSSSRYKNLRLSYTCINFQALQTSLLNLLSNACTHTAEGSVTLGVTKCASANNKPQVEFSVTDTRCGVPLAHRERLFEPFASFQGSVGLGLHIVQKQAEALGGECGYYSNPDSGPTGSVFWIRAPYEPAAGTQPVKPQFGPDLPLPKPCGG